MSTSSLPKLAIPVFTALVLVVVLNAAFGRLAPRHYLPDQKMARAIAGAGAGCALLLGDSRMDAGHSADAFQSGAAPGTPAPCAYNLAIGATDIRGAYLTARRFFALGGRTTLAVLGVSADSVLDPEAPIDPKDMVGNNAIHLAWSVPSDVFTEYPGFPFANIGVADAGFRFLIGRASALGRYQSLVWLSAQRMQDRLTAASGDPHNEFGLLSDMTHLEVDFRQRARERVRSVAAGTTGSLQWFSRLAQLIRAHGVPLTLVELPMRAQFRRQVLESADGQAYRAWLSAQLSAAGAGYLDLSRPDWLDDSFFADALHLNPTGAARFSRDLAARLREKAAN